MNDIVGARRGLFAGALPLVIAVGILLLWYSVGVLVFRHGFGIELPNPVHLLPSEWTWRLR